MKSSYSRLLVALFVSHFVQSAHAQPLFASAKSIECTVANSDIVVVGKLVEFAREEPADDGRAREGTIVVQETLKGAHRDRLQVELSHPVSVLTKWKEQSYRLLVAVRKDSLIAAKVINLTDEELAVLTADFMLLRKPEDVIWVARETARRMPGVRRIATFRLVVPRRAIAGSKWVKYYRTGGYITLTVPVDERLEKRALEYVHSKDYGQREEGAGALRYFRSEANVARAKALLDDPGWSYLRRAEANKGIEVRVYGVRKEAYRSLQYWGVDAEKPLIREEIPKHDDSKKAGADKDF